MTRGVETFEFQTEAKQLLDLMVHSIYSNKDIFLRELISNSSDALDKRRFQGLTDPSVLPGGTELEIRIDPDRDSRTLTVHDNGIGMSRDEVVQLIGTIAKSGTREFLSRIKETREQDLPPELIGQFGVGFYSTFMVADRVKLLTRKAGEEAATRWESTGEGTYTMEEASRPEPGTSVTLHLKAEDSEDGLKDYTDEWVIRTIVKKYSDFVAYPIRLPVTRPAGEEKGDTEKGGDDRSDATATTVETLNSMKAIWLRDESEVKEEEYNEFYKHVSHDWNDPLLRIRAKIEGALEYRLLLFIPSVAPFDLFYRESQRGVHLYVKRVFIMDDCKELLPEYLRFVRGVVDSEDLSLNISREILQQNRQIQRMRKGIVNKVLSTLKDLLESDREKYLLLWEHFGRVLKEGLYTDFENRESLLDLVLCESTKDEGKKTTLGEYVDRMPEGQEHIFFMTGESRQAIQGSPHIEALLDRGYEVLILTDPVDELWTERGGEFRGKSFKSAGKGVVDLGDEDPQKDEERQKQFASILEFLKDRLDDRVKEVRLSRRLKTSAACLVSDEHDLTPQMEELLRASNQPVPHFKRILEVNPDHPLVARMQELFEKDRSSQLLEDFAELLHGQALIAEGGRPANPSQFSRLVSDLMVRATVSPDS